MLQPPSREDVATRWQAVVRGDVPREVASQWAEPLMFAEFDTRPDVLVMQAYLHPLGGATSRSCAGLSGRCRVSAHDGPG